MPTDTRAAFVAFQNPMSTRHSCLLFSPPSARRHTSYTQCTSSAAAAIKACCSSSSLRAASASAARLASPFLSPKNDLESLETCSAAAAGQACCQNRGKNGIRGRIWNHDSCLRALGALSQEPWTETNDSSSCRCRPPHLFVPCLLTPCSLARKKKENLRFWALGGGRGPAIRCL